MTAEAMTIADEFARAFHVERQNSYPEIDAFERYAGAAVDRDKLEAAARVLACPLKAKPPNWQHGRIIYAAARVALRRIFHDRRGVLLLDIGTAKGFSALCLQWALYDAGRHGRVVSLDVIDPAERVRRNTVAEVDGLKTLRETLEPWRESLSIEFVQAEGRIWLTGHPERVHVASVDGKHTYQAVHWESTLLTMRQSAGDVIFFDDLQVPGVAQAVGELRGYDVTYLQAKPDRRYAVAVKR